MTKVEWGKKKVCASCEVKFYDLNRKYPLSCPGCGASIEEDNINLVQSESKKVFSDDVESTAETNLVGSDATESLASDDELPIEEASDESTISLEEADQDIDVMDSDVDDLSIEQNENQIHEE